MVSAAARLAPPRPRPGNPLPAHVPACGRALIGVGPHGNASHYPERLGAAVCFHAPTLFSMTWKVTQTACMAGK
jgi:hypothetical protein